MDHSNVSDRANQLASDLCNVVDALAHDMTRVTTIGDYRKTARAARKVIAVCGVITAIQRLPYLGEDN